MDTPPLSTRGAPSDKHRVAAEELIEGLWTAEEARRLNPRLVQSALVWQSYERPSDTWDHDHCVLCFAKLMDTANPPKDVLNAAYTDDVSSDAPAPSTDPRMVPAPAGSRTWVCRACAKAFQDAFRWTLTGYPEA